ncbi:MAG TPA: septation protein SepH [Mycobacteriales bacterium]|nr:septation protein SepH [Mycobacteriales bacterium]
MRDLHIVGVSDDGRFLVLAGARGAPGEFQIPIDSRLRAAVRGHFDDARLELRPEQPVTPREIQARIRAGESVAEVAQSAGLPPTRVAAYAHPVLAERERAVIEARLCRVGDASRRLGDLVDERLGAQEVDPAASEWDAWRLPDGRWTVQVVYRAHDRLQCAAWTWDPGARRVSAADAPAESLLRGGPATHGSASVAARQAALFGGTARPDVAAAAAPRTPDDVQPTLPAAVDLRRPPAPTDAEPVDEAAGPAAAVADPAPAPAARPTLVEAPVRPSRRARVPSWNEIRETARMPSVPTGDPDE